MSTISLPIIISLILFSELKIVSVDILVSRMSVISMTSESEILLETSKLLLLSEILSLLGSTSHLP